MTFVIDSPRRIFRTRRDRVASVMYLDDLIAAATLYLSPSRAEELARNVSQVFADPEALETPEEIAAAFVEARRASPQTYGLEWATVDDATAREIARAMARVWGSR